MIKAEELRIGNWVDRTAGEMQVKGIVEDGAWFDDGDCENYKYLEPIPLTPEILEKAGFEEIWQGRWQRESVDLFQSEEQKILGGYILLNGEERSHWPNVYFNLHQLQNLFHALCGKELEIKL